VHQPPPSKTTVDGFASFGVVAERVGDYTDRRLNQRFPSALT
jgi:hypothetical protein